MTDKNLPIITQPDSANIFPASKSNVELKMRSTGGSGVISLFFVILFTFAAVAGGVTKVETSSDAAVCGKTVTLADCIQKTLICSPLDSLLAPLMGTASSITACATKTGAPLKSKFFTSLGQSMVSGNSPGIGDELTSNTVADAAIRQCVLNATGMLAPDMTLDRSAIAEQVALLSPPALGASVVGAIETCPEPVNFKIMTFVRCLKKVCIASAVLPTPAPPSYSGMSSFF
ncbi:hypothetical protein SK128_012061 [Halocaridina rubra]|uniref:Uncharacterized protein n=1 Tax=Halocaridina rubra TaxID=373956 RepID=A0AAN8WT25_HALRR